ncbi:MAG: diacylglycerol kinase family protein [Daejeonella sp.]|uniref:diacylglycerol kinase family protein n=1 Tax=Daejeonella sp. TaxID=2805397 RepID=UPI003C72A338
MTKFLKGFEFAWKGILYTFRTQINFRVEVFSAFGVIGLGWFLGLDAGEWLWISLTIMLVLAAELANTAVETLVDLVSPEYDPKAGIVKDIFAALVLLTAFFAVVVALLILLPKILHAA